MSEITVYGLIAVAVFAVVLLVWGMHRAERMRSEALRSLAGRRHWNYRKQIEDPEAEFGAFALFDRGGGKRATNGISGRLDRAEFSLFDYRYVIGGGQHASIHRQTVLVLRSAHVDLPRFELRPESFLHKIGEHFGFQDIDFDASPEFSSLYLLRGDKEKAIRRLFGSGLRRHLEKHPGWSVEGGGQYLLTYHPGKRVDPERIPDFVERTCALLTRFTAEAA